MPRDRSFLDTVGQGLGNASWLLMTPGFALFLLGILVLVVPRLLELIVALALMFLGLFLMTIAWHTRRIRRGYFRWRDGLGDDLDDVRDGTPR